MGYKDNGVFAFLVILHNLAQQHISAHRIKTCGRFVKNENLGIHCYNACNCRPSLFTARKVERRFFKKFIFKSGKSCGVIYRFFKLCAALAHIRRAECDILGNGFFKKLIFWILKYHSDFETDFSDILGICPDILTVKKNLSRSWFHKSV